MHGRPRQARGAAPPHPASPSAIGPLETWADATATRSPPVLWQPVKAKSPAPQDLATDAVRQPPLASLLTELLQGYRRPAIAITDNGSIVCSSPVATRIVSGQADDVDETISADPSAWPRRAAFQADGLTLYLVVPDEALDVNLPDPQHIPPRVAKIARLVISGCTDKQIATQTGLTFATVRTYVRQIYRRLNVHTRVEMVNLSLAQK